MPSEPLIFDEGILQYLSAQTIAAIYTEVEAYIDGSDEYAAAIAEVIAEHTQAYLTVTEKEQFEAILAKRR